MTIKETKQRQRQRGHFQRLLDYSQMSLTALHNATGIPLHTLRAYIDGTQLCDETSWQKIDKAIAAFVEYTHCV